MAETPNGGPRAEGTAAEMIDSARDLAQRNPIALGVAIAQLAEQDPNGVVATALRLVMQDAEMRARWRARRQASAAVWYAMRRDGEFRREHLPHGDIAQRRDEPRIPVPCPGPGGGARCQARKGAGAVYYQAPDEPPAGRCVLCDRIRAKRDRQDGAA